MKRSILPLLALAASLPAHAYACGGCFSPPAPQIDQTVVQNAERVLFMQDPATQLTTVWVEVRYSGLAKDFGWVLPVPKLPTIGVGNTAVLDALDAQMAMRYAVTTSAAENCRDPYEGCVEGHQAYPSEGAADASAGADESSDAGGTKGGGGGVQILAQGTTGPYDYVVVKSTDAQTLYSWLTGHGERPSGAPAVDPQLAWIALSDRYGASGKRDEFTQLLDRYGLALHFTAGRMAEPEILERSREVYRLAMAQIKLLEALAHDAPVPAEPAIHPAVQSATQIAEPPAAPVTPYRGGDDDLPAAMTPAAQGLKPYPPPPSTHIALSIDQLSEFQLGNALNWGKLVNGARFNRAALQRSLASFPGSVADFLDGLAAAAANAVSTPAKGGQ